MKTVTLGKTGITVPQNGFGALPIQRVGMETAVQLLRRAYDGGMRFFDTARAYSDSEEKLGNAFSGYIPRENIYITTKTMAKTPEQFWKDLGTSLQMLKTDYIDVFQFHCAGTCYRLGDGSGMYEAMLEAKAQGRIRHIGITCHLIAVAEEVVKSGLYETLQYPFSYLSTERELKLVDDCRAAGMGFIAMKGLAGGLLNKSKPCMAFMLQFDNVIPIWGVQRAHELEEWLAFFNEAPVMDEENAAIIAADKKELQGDFCRGCGYCMPCPAGIMINQCARISQMVRRAPSANWLSEKMQAEMKKIENCRHCGACVKKCPYGLDTPALLQKNYEDYRRILAGEVSVAVLLQIDTAGAVC